MDASPQPSTNKNKPIALLATAAVLVVGGIIAFASALFKDAKTDQQPVGENTGTVPTQEEGGSGVGGPAETTPTPTAKYKDGTYSLTQTYASPGGNEKFDLSLTFAGDKVTAATFTPKPVSQIGVQLQGKFSQAFQAQVVGKSIDGIAIGVVSGASLTSAAFMKALEALKVQAKI